MVTNMRKDDPRLKNLKPYTTDRKESCTAQLNLRVPPSLSAKIKERENWQEFVRQTLLEKLEAESA